MSKAVAIPEGNKAVGGVMKEEVFIAPEKKDGPIGLFSRLLRFDSLAKKTSAPESPTSTEPPTTYYGVYIPCEIKKGPDEEAIHVYKNKSEALELVKRYKSSRFKAFQNRQDAISFALRGAEPQDVVDGPDNSLIGEKPYPFKAPSPQDMVALRKAIEAGLTSTVRDRVWDNPRFLVSSGNTPAILQEGSRYNALHVSAKAMNAEMCNLILTTVGDPAFVQALYGADADPDSCQEFAEILLDRYLNTPDKAMNETPLHFAAKFGASAAVDVITSFPQCDKDATNKFGERARDIICKRASNSNEETIRRIESMLEERYYVPVIHSEDDSGAPTIGAPFTPAHPPAINVDPLSPRCEIRAFAGPLPPAAALSFRRRWKTPPRRPHAPAPPAPGAPAPAPGATPPAPAPRTRTPFRLQDIDKGLETVGRNLANEMKVEWKEYWPFLDTFTDLRTAEGLALLENYLKAKYDAACSFAYSDSCAEARPPASARAPAPASAPASPMSELCAALTSCQLSDRPPHWRQKDQIRRRLCRRPSLKSADGDPPPPPSHTVSQLLCIERTCLVFAKRIADALVFALSAAPEVAGASLTAEARHLQHTMLTYMGDERFRNIDFALIHSRLAQLVVYKLRQLTTELDDVDHLVGFLVKLRCPNDDIFSSDDERKPRGGGGAGGAGRVRLSRVIEAHVRCLASFVCEELEGEAGGGGGGSAGGERECAELWERARRCRCEWDPPAPAPAPAPDRNGKKNSSFRKNWSGLSTSPKGDGFIRRLTFEQDMGDGSNQQNAATRPVSVNSPAGDSAPPPAPAPAPAPAPDTHKQIEPEISSDDSPEGGGSDGEESGGYHTASERADSDSEMQDASDRAQAEPFIYGEEPSKMDRLVFDALSECPVDPDRFPNVYRWRHTVALYSHAERNQWAPAQSPSESVIHAVWPPPSPSPSPAPVARSTPHKDACRSPRTPRTPHTPHTPHTPAGKRDVSLQVSNWLRVTGPNSPRAALNNTRTHNVSFGF